MFKIIATVYCLFSLSVIAMLVREVGCILLCYIYSLCETIRLDCNYKDDHEWLYTKKERKMDFILIYTSFFPLEFTVYKIKLSSQNSNIRTKCIVFIAH